jgi:isopentenyl-diphosphate Delta-isomerase
MVLNVYLKFLLSLPTFLECMTSAPPFDPDPTAVSRKKDHIDLAFQSRIPEMDDRFFYEPLLSAHPSEEQDFFPFLGKVQKLPIWVSSMTGGTEWAGTINHHLARACGEFGMGMGLGSCRQLLYSDEHLKDFQVRHLVTDAYPLYANLGIAQLEELVHGNRLSEINDLIDKLSADGLIVHINPMQEWMQPEGDKILYPPLETLQRLLDKANYPIIVKEVGQGMGPLSLAALLSMPFAGIEFAARGGTNFSQLELLRADETTRTSLYPMAKIGHSAEEMVHLTNSIIENLGEHLQCKEIIISGGVQNFLDGYYLTNILRASSVYGQASEFLRHARGTYEDLQKFVQIQARGLKMAKAFLRVK